MQLENLVLNTPLTSEQVQQIRGQLATLAPPSGQDERARSTTPLESVRGGSGGVHIKVEPHTMYSHPTSIPGLSGADPAGEVTSTGDASSSSSHPSLLSGQNLERAVRSLLSPGPPDAPAPTPPPPAASALNSQAPPSAGGSGPVGGIDLSLLASLQASGGLSNLLAQAQQQQQQQQSGSRDVKPNLTGRSGGPAVTLSIEDDALVREYDHAIMSLDIKLVNRDLNM